MASNETMTVTCQAEAIEGMPPAELSALLEGDVVLCKYWMGEWVWHAGTLEEGCDGLGFPIGEDLWCPLGTADEVKLVRRGGTD